MTSLASLLLASGGFSCLSLSMTRHARQVGRVGSERTLRAMGWLLLAFTLAIALTTPGWRIALVEWCGIISLAAAIVVILLYRRAALVPKVATAAPVAAIAILMLTLFS